MKTCSYLGCDRPHLSKGYCSGHYSQLKSGKELVPIGSRYRNRQGECDYSGCQNPILARRLCRSHYQQLVSGKELQPLVPKNSTDGECSYEDCGRRIYAKLLCVTHYDMQLSGKQLRPIRAADAEPTWTRDTYGYIVRSIPDGTGKYRQEKQHRLVMEQKLGRKLLPGENVHHINGVRDDNRPENLELWSVSQPAGQRVRDKLQWAREMILQYEDEEGIL